MNYRHIYHAGSFSDVVKHCVLIALLQSLQRKLTPFCYLDTHAGLGVYNLQSAEVQKNPEFKLGIEKIRHYSEPPAVVADYLTCIKTFNSEQAEFNNYPGSPAIARYFARSHDRLILSELHPEDVLVLKQQFAKDKQVAVHYYDGYQALKAFLPPKENRGLVLLDPAFEKIDELSTVISGLQTALKKWAAGVYMIWYPIKELAPIEKFYMDLQQLEVKNILITEFAIYPWDNPIRLNGCGIAIINAPWQLDQQLNIFIPWLWNALSVSHQGSYQIKFIS